MFDPLELARRFAAMSADLSGGKAQADVLSSLAECSIESLEWCDWAGVTQLNSRGKSRVLTSTSGVVQDIDRLQWELKQGPLWTMVGPTKGAEDTCVVGDLEGDTRWPAFSKLAGDSIPVRSIVAGALDERGPRLALSLYGAAPLTQIQANQGLLLIEHARALLKFSDSRSRAVSLRDALESNRQIGVAVGIIMGSSKVTSDRAFDMLRTTSQHLNRKIR